MPKAPMTITRRKPAQPFMIEREGQFYYRSGMRAGWETWDGLTFATRKDAQDVIDIDPAKFLGARIVEVVDEVRTTRTAAE